MHYKVVRKKDDGSFWSVLSWSPVEYKVGQPTCPPKECGPLACFSSIETARQCIWRNHWAEDFAIAIFECNIEPSQTCKLWTSYNVETLLCTLPEGTVLADEVTLIAQIGGLVVADVEESK